MSRPAHSRPLGVIAVGRIAVRLIRLLRRCEAGQGLVEYALMLALVAMGLIGVVLAFRNALGGALNTTSGAISVQAGSGYGGPQASPSPPIGPSSPVTPEPTPDSSAAGKDSSGAGGVTTK
jgi:Flp pilus assembly pilin Flp